MDTSVVCGENSTNYVQNLIEVLRWIVKLGRIDIAFEFLSLFKFLSHPETGHIYQALHVFKYLEIY